MSEQHKTVVLNSPYLSKSHWLRGNLHTHTTASDGARSAEEVIRDYEQRGYDFLSISDHDVLVSPDKYQRHTTMALIPGVEVTANGPHILHVNPRTQVAPDKNRQTVLDEIAGQPQGFAVLNHPNWLAPLPDLHFPHDLMRSLKGYVGIEIYNGVIERLPGVPLATDQWDLLLSKGLPAWGFGHDDSHDVQDMALAWNMVQSESLLIEDIVEAMRAGRFYVSTGVFIQSVRVTDRRISIITSNATRIRFVGRWGVILHAVDSQAAEFTAPENPAEAEALRYIRIECLGPGGDMAWTQPIWIQTA